MGLEDLILPVGLSAAAVAASATLAWAWLVRFHVPVPPNRALVLFGRRASAPRTGTGPLSTASGTEVRRPRIVVGGGVFVAPWTKGVGHLSLEPVVVDLNVRSIHAIEGNRASGWETRLRVQAKIPADPALLESAAENLLGKGEEELRAIVRHVVEGAVPSVLARLRSDREEPDWERLASEIQASVAPDLVALGLVVRSLSVIELHRIAPTTPPEGATPALPARAAPPAGVPTGPSSPIDQLDLRLARAERSLGIMGAEVLRLAREAIPPPDGPAGPGSVFDFPLGYEGSGATLASGSSAFPTHDSMGGERSPRTGRTSAEDRDGEGEREPRPLLDTER